MSRRITCLGVSIEPRANYLAVLYDDRSNGKTTLFKRIHGLLVSRCNVWVHGASPRLRNVEAKPLQAIQANGSFPASRFQMYSMKPADLSAASCPRNRAIKLNAMSMPADTPEEVMMSPSSTQRA